MSRRLLRTTEAGNPPHYHIVYIDDVTGTGVVTEADGHTHQIQGQPDQEGVLQWTISVAPDGHTHAVEDYEIKQEPAEEDNKVISDCRELFKAAIEEDAESLKAAMESDEFYQGKQWDLDLKSRLESEKRAALTINWTQRDLNELFGHQRQQRTDLRFLPMEDGDEFGADVLNHLSKHALEQCFFEREESEIFEDAGIGGRGVVNLSVDYNNDLEGEPKVERFPYSQVVFGAHEKKDASDAEHLHKFRMFSLGRIKALWPNKADEVTKDFDLYCGMLNDPIHRDPTDQYLANEQKTPVTIAGEQMVDTAKKEYRVVETQQKVYHQGQVAVDQQTKETFQLYGWKAADVNAVESIPGISIIKKVITKYRITRWCGNVVLIDENPADLPVDDFFTFPVYAHKRGSRWWGKVEIVKDAQRECNKRTSQSIDIGNRMTAYGWFYDQNTFQSKEEKERFKKGASTPGFLQEVADTGRPPSMVQGASFPAEMANLIAMSQQNISQLMNVTVQSEEGDSPAAILQKQRLRLVANEFLFDSLSFAKKKIGRLLAAIFQKHYSPERVFRILSNRNAREPLQLAGQNFEDISKQKIIDFLQNHDLTKYDVIASESSWSPSERVATQMLLTDMQGKGVPVPPDVILKLSDIPEDEKNQMIQSIQQQQQSSQQAESSKQETEIQKTLIARGIIPPKVAQQQGLSPEQLGPGQTPQQPQQPPQPQNEQGDLSGLQ